MSIVKRICAVFVMLFVFCQPVQACVGRILSIGAIDTPAGRVMAETLALFITERTGTTVNTTFFPESTALYEAIGSEQVGIFVENTVNAVAVVKGPDGMDLEQAYQYVKTAFRKEKDLVWLKPFRFVNVADLESKAASATVLSLKVMTDFPGLQRLLNKLADRVDEQAYADMVKRTIDGEKPARVAKDFLEREKLI